VHPAWSPERALSRAGGHVPPAGPHGWTVLLTVAVLFLSGALVLWQVTAPSTAQRLVRAAVAATVDPRGYVADRGEELRRLAADGTVVRPPGFAIPVALQAAEVAGASDAELAGLLLTRATDAVLVEGPRAFDPEGQATYSRFSRAGLLAWFIDVLRNERLHHWSGVAALALAVLAAALGAAVASRAAPGRRLALLGWAFVVGSTPGLVFFGAIAFWLERAGHDPFTELVAGIAAEVFAIGRNDCAAILAGGAVLIAANRGLAWLAARSAERAPEPDPTEGTEWASEADAGWEGDVLNES